MDDFWATVIYLACSDFWQPMTEKKHTTDRPHLLPARSLRTRAGSLSHVACSVILNNLMVLVCSVLWWSVVLNNQTVLLLLVLWWLFTSNNLMVVVYRSEGGGGSSGLRKFESRASLNTNINNESPSLASKFGSSFTVNKHKKVLLFFFTTWDRSMFQWLGSSCDYHFDHQRHSRLTLTHLTNLNLRPKEEKRDFLRFTFITEYHTKTYLLM